MSTHYSTLQQYLDMAAYMRDSHKTQAKHPDTSQNNQSRDTLKHAEPPGPGGSTGDTRSAL